MRDRDAAERDRQRAEELQGHREAEPDPVDRGVQGEVHRREDQPEQQGRPPLGPGEAAQPRPGDRQQDGGRDELPDRDHAGRTDGGEGVRAEGGADLVAGAAGQHRQRPRSPSTGAGSGAGAVAGDRVTVATLMGRSVAAGEPIREMHDAGSYTIWL